VRVAEAAHPASVASTTSRARCRSSRRHRRDGRAVAEGRSRALTSASRTRPGARGKEGCRARPPRGDRSFRVGPSPRLEETPAYVAASPGESNDCTVRSACGVKLPPTTPRVCGALVTCQSPGSSSRGSGQFFSRLFHSTRATTKVIAPARWCLGARVPIRSHSRLTFDPLLRSAFSKQRVWPDSRWVLAN